MHIWAAYEHMYTKYEVSMSNQVQGGCAQMMMPTPMQDDDGQFMIV